MVKTKKKLESECSALWSKAVKERDGYKCRCCGKLSSDSHHIISRRYSATRYDVDNGIALCRKHHNHSNAKEMLSRIIEIIGIQKYSELVKRANIYKCWREPDLLELKNQLKLW